VTTGNEVRGSGRLLRLFSGAVAGQVVLSGTSFIVGLLLIRYTGDADYATYILAQASIGLLVTAQSAWVSGPLSVVAAKRDPEARRRMAGAVSESLRRFTLWVALASVIVPVVAWAIGASSALMAAVSALTIGAGWLSLRRDYFRNLLQLYARARGLVSTDVVSSLGLVGFAVLAAFGPFQADLVVITGLGLSAWIGGLQARRLLRRDPGLIDDGKARQYWQQMRSYAFWGTTGALIYWVFSQSYNYVLAARIDLAAVADVNATRLLLMPTIVMTTGVRGLLIPMAARWLVEVGLDRLLKRLMAFAAALAVLHLGYVAVLWLGRDWVTGTLMKTEIADRDQLLLLWAAIALIGVLRETSVAAVLALEKFRVMAYFTGASAVVSLALMWFGLPYWGAAAALIGQVAGELVGLACVAVLLIRADRHPPPPLLSPPESSLMTPPPEI
jgi:O-antigen/teichoic acid export membrane protein